MSGNRLKKLTQRLQRGIETPEDLYDLADVLIYYRRVLDSAHADIERLCAGLPHAQPMAPRVKTLKTTLESCAGSRNCTPLHRFETWPGCAWWSMALVTTKTSLSA